MCPEMDEGIGPETFLRIQVRCQVTVGWRHFHTMHEFEVIVAQCRTGLREQEYVAIPQAGYGDAVAVCEETAWCLSIMSLHICIFLWCKHLLGPSLILSLGQPDRMPFTHVLLLRALGIRTEYQSFSLHLTRKGIETFGQTRHVVPLLAKT